MISALRSVLRLVDIPIFSKIFERPPRSDLQNECVTAVDIGESTIAVRLIGADGRMFIKAECPTLANRGYGSGLHRISKMLRTVTSVSGFKISCIDIGCIGRVNPFTGEFGDVELAAWRGSNLVGDLLRKFRVPVSLKMTHTPQLSASRGAIHKKTTRG